MGSLTPRRPVEISPMTPEQLDRFMSMIIPEPNSGCWIWLGYVGPRGYGSFYPGVGGRMQRAHRTSYVHFVGPIPEGKVLDHVRARGCGLCCCVNPDHLEPVSSPENIRRGNGYAGLNARKTACIRGHVLVGENVKHDRRGGRECRMCISLRNKAVRELRRAARMSQKEANK